MQLTRISQHCNRVDNNVYAVFTRPKINPQIRFCSLFHKTEFHVKLQKILKITSKNRIFYFLISNDLEKNPCVDKFDAHQL